MCTSTVDMNREKRQKAKCYYLIITIYWAVYYCCLSYSCAMVYNVGRRHSHQKGVSGSVIIRILGRFNKDTRKRAGKTERDFRCPICRSAIGHVSLKTVLVLLATSSRCNPVFFAKSAYYVGVVFVRPWGSCSGRGSVMGVLFNLCPYGHYYFRLLVWRLRCLATSERHLVQQAVLLLREGRVQQHISDE